MAGTQSYFYLRIDLVLLLKCIIVTDSVHILQNSLFFPLPRTYISKYQKSMLVLIQLQAWAFGLIDLGSDHNTK